MAPFSVNSDSVFPLSLALMSARSLSSGGVMSLRPGGKRSRKSSFSLPLLVVVVVVVVGALTVASVNRKLANEVCKACMCLDNYRGICFG